MKSHPMKEANFIILENGIISAVFKDGSGWELPVSEIALIGEYSTEEGPGVDDYFLCLVDNNGSIYTIGSEEGAFRLIDDLTKFWGVDLDPRLNLCTNNESRILFPFKEKGKALFDFVDCVPKSLIERLKLIFMKRQEMKFSSTANKIIQNVKC